MVLGLLTTQNFLPTFVERGKGSEADSLVCLVVLVLCVLKLMFVKLKRDSRTTGNMANHQSCDIGLCINHALASQCRKL